MWWMSFVPEVSAAEQKLVWELSVKARRSAPAS
jgi:hypothetical protein